jgi:hypothetical protein
LLPWAAASQVVAGGIAQEKLYGQFEVDIAITLQTVVNTIKLA